jgi:hypothetical protein
MECFKGQTRQWTSFQTEKHHRAPLWSWATVDGIVQMDVYPNTYNMEVEIIDAEAEPRGNDSFEQIKGGFIRLGYI